MSLIYSFPKKKKERNLPIDYESVYPIFDIESSNPVEYGQTYLKLQVS